MDSHNGQFQHYTNDQGMEKSQAVASLYAVFLPGKYMDRKDFET